ncbi:MAG: SoxR reducing system RseC family protein [Woeseiaceae bacterium]|nr:SoxR reducing system RseC family protein [Woeseiaceae bacterium]
MDSPQGRILSIHDDREPVCAVVEITAPLRCARCAAGKGCGAGIAGPDGGPRKIEVRLAPGLELRAGDRVRVDVAPADILGASLIVYGLPLAGAVLGAGAAYLANAGDLGAALAALAGIGAGMLVARGRLRRTACPHRFTPIATSRIAGAG